MTEDSAGEVRQRLKELERRVAYLEEETGHSFDEKLFRERMERVFDDYSFEIDEQSMGGYEAIVTVPPDALHDAVERTESIDDVVWEILEVTKDGSVQLLVQEGLVNRKI
jgi:hypothetical protein